MPMTITTPRTRRAKSPNATAAASANIGRARLSDVARAAGVSTMTVVRVIHEPDKVAANTRERVQHVLAATGYTPNLVARGLASSRTGLIAAVIPVLTNSLIAEIMQGLTDAIAPSGHHLLLGASGFSAAEEEILVRAFLSHRIDGIYLTGAIHTAETIAMLKRAAIPVVEGGNLTRQPIDMLVGYSNVDAARAVTRHLVKAGYAPIGYIGAYPHDNDRARDRRRGYELALTSARRKVDPRLCVETSLDIDSGAAAMATLIERRRGLRAVFCSADAIAVGALFECQRRGIAVPGEIAIAGFDDIPIAAQVVPSLTTLRVPRYSIGQRAGEMICDRLAGRTVKKPIVDAGFEMVPRDSA
jgi:LacI family gluconate utilization system Gnt-I transcriptional repressor